MTLKTVAAAGRLMLVVALGFAASACATIVSGTSQELNVSTEPAGAECRVERQGAMLGVVKFTPGKVTVRRHKDNIVVSCTRADYETSNEILASSFTGATFGNLLLGGFVGVVIDASSGANNKYPERVVIVMTPAVFPDVAARDTYYEGVKSRLRATADAEIKRIMANCSSTGRELCNTEAREIGEARDKALADIEAKRLAARVATTS